MLVVLVIGAAFATVALIDDLIDGGSITNSAGELLLSGGLVFADIVIAFAFCTGKSTAVGRVVGATGVAHPDFAFPQQTSPHLAPAGLASGVLRLFLSRPHEFDRVQPHRHDAPHAPGQVGHERPVDRLPRGARIGHCQCGQRAWLGPCCRSWALIRSPGA